MNKPVIPPNQDPVHDNAAAIVQGLLIQCQLIAASPNLPTPTSAKEGELLFYWLLGHWAASIEDAELITALESLRLMRAEAQEQKEERGNE